MMHTRFHILLICVFITLMQLDILTVFSASRVSLFTLTSSEVCNTSLCELLISLTLLKNLPVLQTRDVNG